VPNNFNFVQLRLAVKIIIVYLWGIILNNEAIVLEIFIQIFGMANTYFSVTPKGN